MKLKCLFGLAFIAATALFSSCSDDKDQPAPPSSFEERAEAYNAAFATDPLKEEKMTRINMIVRDKYFECRGVEGFAEIGRQATSVLQGTAAAMGVYLSDQDASMCALYLRGKYYDATISPTEFSQPAIPIDALSDKAKGFVNSLSQQAMDRIARTVTFGTTRDMMTSFSLEQISSFLEEEAELIMQFASEYGIAFTPDEAKQLSDTMITEYYKYVTNFLKGDENPATFEERAAAFREAFSSDPKKDEIWKSINTLIRNRFKQTVSDEENARHRESINALVREAAAVKGFNLSDEETMDCALYLGNLRYFNTVERDESDPDLVVVTYDMLKGNAKAFIDSYSMEERVELNTQMTNKVLLMMIDALEASSAYEQMVKQGAATIIECAYPYGIMFSLPEAERLLSALVKDYRHSLIGDLYE